MAVALPQVPLPARMVLPNGAGRREDQAMSDDRTDATPEAMDYIDIVFDGPPSHESGRFVEVENSTGESIRFGEWIHRPDGYWVLRFQSLNRSEEHTSEL